jgi:hypothetical protein
MGVAYLAIREGSAARRRVSDRQKPHKGRDRSGHYRVRQADVEDVLENREGTDFLQDDVRLGGAVEDTGQHAGESGKEIERLIDDNKYDVSLNAGRRPRSSSKRSSRTRPRRGRR